MNCLQCPTALCCCQLETGARVISWIHLVFWMSSLLLFLAIIILALLMSNLITRDLWILLGTAFGTLLSFVLHKGIHEKRPFVVLIGWIALFVFEFLELLVMEIAYNPLEGEVVFLPYIAFQLYSVLVMCAFYRQLRNNQELSLKTASGNLKPLEKVRDETNFDADSKAPDFANLAYVIDVPNIVDSDDVTKF